MSTYNLDSLSCIATRLYGGTPHAPDKTCGDGRDWTADALCGSRDPEMWFPNNGRVDQHRLAEAICQECPVRAQCLSEALANPWITGIWGGTSETDRKRMRRRSA